MSLEHKNELYTSEIKIGEYILKIETFEAISAGFEVFYDLETSAFLKGCSGHCPPVEEFAKKHNIILYYADKNFRDRSDLYASAKKFHEEQIENIKQIPFDKLRICLQFSVKDFYRINEFEALDADGCSESYN